MCNKKKPKQLHTELPFNKMLLIGDNNIYLREVLGI